MRHTRLIRPEYSANFRCIGPACEDSCCQGWAVFIDQPTYEKYQAIPPGPLRILIDENIVPTAALPDGSAPVAAASIKMPPSLQCPFHGEDRLCQIQVEHGEDFLCRTCATFPRVVHCIDGFTEKALCLSCPEAARLVLLDPHLMAPRGNEIREFNWDERVQCGTNVLPFFWPIREFVIALARNRSYPLWQRLFLLGTFSRRLDAIASGEVQRNMAEFLSEFAAALGAGALTSAMDKIQPNLALQLETVLRLATLCRSPASAGARFIECFEAFKQGIGFTPTTTLETLIEHYAEANRRFYAPFFLRHPHILENYLVNAIFRRQFPFGLKAGSLIVAPHPAREFALLATQFALVKGLLIGVAGSRKESFSTNHVIHTVQSAMKHFEHHPEFLDKAHALLAANGHDNAHGLTMLLRDPDARAPGNAAAAESVPKLPAGRVLPWKSRSGTSNWA